MSQNILGGSLPDDDKIDHDKTDTFKPWLRQPDTSDVLSQIKISGDKDLQQKIRKVCLKYRDIFSNELPAAPAKIPEFTLDVQKEMWLVARSRAPPRLRDSEQLHAYLSEHKLDTCYRIYRSVSCTTRNYKHCLPLEFTIAT